MTHKQWTKLTPKEQRICVALAAGWNYPKEKDAPKSFPLLMCTPGSLLYARLAEAIPDYINDLNAMHKAEASLADDRKLWNRYEDELVRICCRDDRKPVFMCGEVYHFHATATQRAEAFVLTTETK